MAASDPTDYTKTGEQRRAFGDRLHGLREARHLSIESIANATRIQARYLKALETGAYDQLPGEVFARGFVRNVAKIIDADPEALVADFSRCWKGMAAAAPPSEMKAESLKNHVQKAPNKRHRLSPQPRGGIPLRGIASYLAGLAALALVALAIRYAVEHRGSTPRSDAGLALQTSANGEQHADAGRENAQDLPASKQSPAVESSTDQTASIAVPPAAKPLNSAAVPSQETKALASHAAVVAASEQTGTSRAAKQPSNESDRGVRSEAAVAKAPPAEVKPQASSSEPADAAAKQVAPLPVEKSALTGQVGAAAAAQTELANDRRSDRNQVPDVAKTVESPTSSDIGTRPLGATQSLEMLVSSPVRVRMSVDSGATETKELAPDTYKFQFSEQATLLIYDASALKIIYNGRDLGDLGVKGRHRRLSFQSKKPPSSSPF